MKIALIGYGNMGREVESLIKNRPGYDLIAIQAKRPGDAIDNAQLSLADVAIDFTGADAVLGHVKACAEAGVNMVIGTTGWEQQRDEVKKLAESAGIGVVYGSNFSIGVQIFLRLVAEASRLFSEAGDYDVYGLEVHHAGKQDSPSGTAKILSKVITDNFQSKAGVQFERANGKISPRELHFVSARGGHNPGRHQITFDGPHDEVTLTHSARGRGGFAAGALLAAQFVHGKKGFFSFEEVIQKEIGDARS